MRDLYSIVDVVTGITPVVNTSVIGAINTGSIDLKGYDSAMVVFEIGDNGGDTLNSTNKFTVKLEHALDNGTGVAGSFVAVGDDDIVGGTQSSGVVFTIDAAAEDEATYRIGYVGGYRFIKVTITPNGTLTNGNPVAVNIVKGHPQLAPTS